ncbi:23096_t:CDS:2 [Gigaspora margarita]|uniref:23096_t:CDS:1 n=1 Tax=Gigaspora margarita TaxID=4874 RepID=A0ABM8VVK0_GIGMA|nr:23096_t:CDS:2 [Gigaspora margarita]
MNFFVLRSGGQTGVDNRIVDAALENIKNIVNNNSSQLIIKKSNVQFIIARFCPKGQKCKYGKIDNQYPIVELNIDDYEFRSRINVLFCDAVLALTSQFSIDDRTFFTINYAKEIGRPTKTFNLLDDDDMNISQIIKWLDLVKARSLNTQINTIYTLGPEGSFAHAATLQIKNLLGESEIIYVEKEQELKEILKSLKTNEYIVAPTHVNGIKKPICDDIYRFKTQIECKNWLNQNTKNMSIILVDTTSKAASMVNLKSNSASISAENCSVFYNLNILDRDIQDSDNNKTTFACVGKFEMLNDQMRIKIINS